MSRPLLTPETHPVHRALVKGTPGMAPSNGAVTSGDRPPAGGRRSEGFLKGLAKFDRVTLVSHVHPDPDSIGSMLGLAHLIQIKLGLPTKLTQDGFIGR